MSTREPRRRRAGPVILAELVAWIRAFVEEFYEEETFIKRKRDRKRIDLVQDGIGDPRIGKAADIYASPTLKRRRLQ